MESYCLMWMEFQFEIIKMFWKWIMVIMVMVAQQYECI